ncbi:hypothetical protein PHMEG_00018340 [Phytophthora megakarya]|uniref:Uncharacterized protein n=1 Tax=Phytophthora megakarya TaxID=4795 RepID=A0A225VUK6_9STRA|nr:hypothetical protein PHMEG_00018340 [Phytophthora megakarya]
MSFDPFKVMELLSALPEDEQKQVMQEAMDQMDDLQEQAIASSTQEGLVQHFKSMRKKNVRPGGICAEEILRSRTSSSPLHEVRFTTGDAKPNSTTKSLKSLKPMTAKELQLGTTHRGRYLCGWVAVDDAFFGIASTTLLLKDVTGYLVEIAVYGLVDTNLPNHEKQHFVATKFPKGTPIVVIEPYFKVRQDMTEGVRVDQVNEIVSWNDVPVDLTSWKKLGNDFFLVLNAVNEGQGVLACYQKAIEAAQPDVSELALLFNNLAACRYKVGDYATAIQLAGVSVHLEHSNIKGWFRLASALVEAKTEGTNWSVRSIAERVVAHACRVIPSLTSKQTKLLESTLKRDEKSVEPNEPNEYSHFNSYAEWCIRLASPNFLIMPEKQSLEPTEEFRKVGSEYFSKGDYSLAEAYYRKGVSESGCRHNVSIVLNNIAATYLMLHRETQNVSNVSVDGVTTTDVPLTEMAILNCTIAGILDPLNHKAWIRRANCLHYLGFSPEDCTADLQGIYDNISDSSSDNNRVQEFKLRINAAIKQRSEDCTTDKHVQPVSEVPTKTQREERDALQTPLSGRFRREQRSGHGSDDVRDSEKHETTIDEYIDQMETFENMVRLAFATKKTLTTQEIPREMAMFNRHPPPKIHIEFPRLRGWPEGLDPTFARKVLYRAYLDASSSPWVTALAMRNREFYENTDRSDLIKRWNGTGAIKIMMANSEVLQLGDIIDGREAFEDAVPLYDARIRSNFANNPNRAETYFFGTTHVAIGFNDFSSLIAATLRNDINSDGPLKFIGFEMSEFAVAKCKVVAQMLGSSDVAIESVMEVWLSSTWSGETLKSFRKTVKEVLRSLEGQNTNKKILSYLKNWVIAEPLSAGAARSEFFQNLERCNAKALGDVCCFRREIDRVDLTQYMLTGEIRKSNSAVGKCDSTKSASGIATTKSKKRRDRKKKQSKEGVTTEQQNPTISVGSLAMWNVPFGAPPLEEEIAFNTVDFTKILHDYTAQMLKQSRSVEKLSIVDLFIIHIIENLQRLRDLMLRNKLTIEVNYGVVKAVRGETANDPENNALLIRIAVMRPYTISWSNVLDYFLPEDFHDLARRCSMFGDCMHYGYSMNWSTQVFGMSLLDYDYDNQKPLIDAVLDSALGFKNTSTCLPCSLSDFCRGMGLDELVTLPFRENPLNLTGYVLAQGLKQSWIDHFKDKGQLTTKAATRLEPFCSGVNCGFQTGEMQIGIPSPLYRTSLTLYLSWCYDPEMNLQRKAQNEMDI